MSLNADFSLRVVQRAAEAQWVPSPLPGVTRRMLDRVGGEVARATSVVRYEAGSRFSRHVHGGGEEFLVLDGVFSDEAGDYPAGSYVRNPPGTAHAPFSHAGCVLLVKLWQFAPDDRVPVRIDTRNPRPWQPSAAPGLSILPLHQHGGVHTSLVRWQPHTLFMLHHHSGGEELYVLEGTLCDDQGEYPAGTWLRNPPGSEHTPFTREQGALVYLKTGGIGAAMIPLPPG
jgi:anti-sigma factor ChrR (cupin superfamily)